MSKLREAFTWAEYHRPPLAFLSVALKFVRVSLWVPLMIALMPKDASMWAWVGVWLYFALGVAVWLADSVIDADGSGS